MNFQLEKYNASEAPKMKKKGDFRHFLEKYVAKKSSPPPAGGEKF